VLYGTIVFAAFAGIYFWFPKITGRMLDDALGKFHFWATFIGFHLTFLVQHWLGAEGMPRRYVDYLPSDGFTTLEYCSSCVGCCWITKWAGRRLPGLNQVAHGHGG